MTTVCYTDPDGTHDEPIENVTVTGILLLTGVFAIQAVHPVATIDSVVRSGIEGGVYPGAVVLVGTADSVLLSRGYGHLTWSTESASTDPGGTLWDLASLTKVTATTPAMMRLVDEGRVDLDDPVQRYLPDFQGEGKEDVTVRDLLAHTTGLRAFLDLSQLTETAADARRRVMDEPLRWERGRRVEYSDLNAMLAGWVVEAVSGVALDEYFAENVAAPLGMTETRYGVRRADRSRTAPINVWRGHPIQGVVHDQNAERLGGVAGHAGLYSTGSDMARYARMYLGSGRTGDSRFVGEGVAAEFTRRGSGNRALGWEVKDTTEIGSAGSLMSPRAFGHGGYTGTSVWIDPQHDVFVVLLTNRVYNPRTRRSIARLRAIRGAVADAAVLLRARTCRILALGRGESPDC